jgi:hypothetical protein
MKPKTASPATQSKTERRSYAQLVSAGICSVIGCGRKRMQSADVCPRCYLEISRHLAENTGPGPTTIKEADNARLDDN